jgi:hypothetical protein
MAAEKKKGECEGCRNCPRVLTQIESGQWVCRSCLREIRGPRISYVSAGAVASLRKKGFNVPDKVTREEYHRLADEYQRTWQLREIRKARMRVADDTSLDDLDRLWRIARLRDKGVQVSESATADEIHVRERLRHFFTKVAGVSHENRNGTSRQEIISRCRQWEQLRFMREHENPVDANAVAVVRANVSASQNHS